MSEVNYPDNWNVRRLKFVANVSTSNVDKHIYEHEIQVKLCNYTDVYYNDRITDEFEFSAGSVTTKELERFALRRGQVLMTKDSESWDDIAVPAYVGQDLPNVVCGYHLAIVEPIGDDLNGEFFKWAALSDSVNDHYKLEARGVTRFGLGHYPLKNVIIGYPKLDEQLKINKYLRVKTAEIDSLIVKKRELLKLLTEKRAALITKTVTKGLDLSVTMKPTGIAWLGDIPEHWMFCRMRFVSAINKSRRPASLNGEDLVSFVPMKAIGENDEFNSSEVKTVEEIGTSYTPFQENDILIAKITPCFENGKGAVARSLKNGFAYGTSELFVLTASKNVDVNFLYLITKSRPFRQQGEAIMTGAGGQKRISSEFVKNFICPLPPVEEQELIAKEIQRIFDQFEETGSLVMKAIERLIEYRAAIITMAVTGDLEVI